MFHWDPTWIRMQTSRHRVCHFLMKIQPAASCDGNFVLLVCAQRWVDGCARHQSRRYAVAAGKSDASANTVQARVDEDKRRTL